MIGKSGILKIAVALLATLLIGAGLISLISNENEASASIEVPDYAQKERIHLEDGTEVGSAFVWSENLEMLYVKIEMDDGWEMERSLLTFETSLPDVVSGEDEPIVDNFQNNRDHKPSRSEYLYKFRINNMFTKEDILYLASYLEIINTTDSNKKGIVQDGWAGTNLFQGSSHASYFIYKFQSEEVWPPSGTASFGFEDLPLISDGESEYKPNDWDYNDFVFDVRIRTSYFENILTWIEWEFTAEERTAAFAHTLMLSVEKETFHSDGSIQVEYMSGNGTETLDSFEQDFLKDEDLEIGIFVSNHTKEAMEEYQTSRIRIDFQKGFRFDLSHSGYNELDAHATDLFFDPFLRIPSTGEEIHTGDLRIVFVPEDWEWPMPDKTPIWEIYPYDFLEGKGVYHDEEADIPIFVGQWYMLA